MMDAVKVYVEMLGKRNVRQEDAATLVVAQAIGDVADQFKRLNDMVEKSLKDSK